LSTCYITPSASFAASVTDLASAAAPSAIARVAAADAAAFACVADADAAAQGLTLVPICAQLELLCPPCDPT
jgi:hypothetical protein